MQKVLLHDYKKTTNLLFALVRSLIIIGYTYICTELIIFLTSCLFYEMDLYGQHHGQRDLRTYAKSVDSDQPPRLRRCVCTASAIFDTCYINGNYLSCCVNNIIMYRCFQHRIGADLGIHYVECSKVPFSRHNYIKCFLLLIDDTKCSLFQYSEEVDFNK